MLKIIKVAGSSLSPFFSNGDYVLICGFSLILKRIKTGDFVVFNHPEHGVMIKKIKKVFKENGELFVVGTHPASVDSRSFGPIPLNQVYGKVISHFTP